MRVNDFLTKYEMKAHKKTFSNKLRKENLPLFLSMQMVYGQSLEKYIEECPDDKKDELLLNEIKTINEFIAKLKVIHDSKYPGKLVFTNSDDTDIFIDKKLQKSAKPILKWYLRRSRIHEILKKKKIDLIYVY